MKINEELAQEFLNDLTPQTRMHAFLKHLHYMCVGKDCTDGCPFYRPRACTRKCALTGPPYEWELGELEDEA